MPLDFLRLSCNNPSMVLRKLTAKRKIVLKSIENFAEPVDAATIVEEVGKKAKIDRATVFRTINFLLEKGQIKKIEFGDGKARFEEAGDHHHHLVCENCGTIEKISNCIASFLEKEVERKNKFLIKRHSLEFFGLCANCQK